MTFLMFRINNDVKMINKLIVKALGFWNQFDDTISILLL